MFASKDVFLKSTGGYTIARSVRLRSSATAYFNRTQTTGNQKTWTWSGWVKRGLLGIRGAFLMAGGNANDYTFVGFNTDDTIRMLNYLSGTKILDRSTTAVYRDPSAWYHIVVAFDTTNATAASRQRLYVNGVEVISFTNTTLSSLNDNTYVDANAVTARIGYDIAAGTYFDGYLAEVNFIDGQALTSSSFGAIRTNGVWQPARYTGTYGTNGFYLNFSDNSAATAAAIGKDSSGNGNNWTPNGINLTTPASTNTNWDSMTDVPTLTSATAANYPTWNPLTAGGLVTFSEANLRALSTSASAPFNIETTIRTPSTGKFYVEITAAVGTGLPAIGIGTNVPDAYACMRSNGTFINSISGLSTTGTAVSFVTGDVIGMALDVDAKTLSFYKNNVLAGGFTNVPTTGYPFIFRKDSASGDGGYLNCGQRPFAYTAPTGFVALNTYNLSTPTIANGAAYMAATLYTGTGASQTIANTVNSASFKPDLVWIKVRSTAIGHRLFDSIRGVGNYLISNSTLAETSNADTLTSFNSNGFGLAANVNADVNGNGSTYVGWQWLAGAGSSSSNTNGSITSTVSAGTTQGFSVVTYTGTGANATVGHGLGVAPSMIIFKNRSDGTTSWCVYHTSLGISQQVFLNTTAAATTVSNKFSGTSSSVIGINTGTDVNGSTNAIVAYVFAPVAGYSAFGSYTGNGSTDGPFVYLGFRPRWVMVKRTDSTSDWYIWDTSRDTYNVVAATLFSDTSGAETSATSIDDLSNGFKCRSATVVNVSTGTYIYAAFAENPFKYSLAR